MARRPPSRPERPIQTPEEKRQHIARLRRRIEELEAFDPATVTKRHSDPKVGGLEKAIDATLQAAFGHGTVEYRQYSGAAKLDRGPVTLSVGPEWGGRVRPQNDAREAQRYVAEGKALSLETLRQAVRALEEEIEFAPSSSGPLEPKFEAAPSRRVLTRPRSLETRQRFARACRATCV